MKVGITATQLGLTEYQKLEVRADLISLGATEFHHGDCIGGDADGHDIAEELGLKIVIHPPSNPSKRAFKRGHSTHRPKPYLERNHDIVDDVDKMLGCPKSEKEEWRGSGTWATIRYARKRSKLKRIIFPN